MNNWIENEVSISEIETLLNEGYEIEIDSPDGYVPVNEFVDKGMYEEYVLTTESNKQVRCNHNHLFETPDGFVFASNFPTEVITKDGVEKCTIRKSGEVIPIVDIVVGHENHRYYAEGVSSHNTNVGKSLFMCSAACNMLEAGKNVLYITMEMAEERIAERLDANLLNISLDDIEGIPKNTFFNKIKAIGEKTKGKLFVKEYPTASAHAGHFESLLKELAIKKSFVPDVIFIDYLNICCSVRYKASGNVNSYTMIKSIAEELRGLAVKHKVPIISATQTNRTGFTSSDPGLENTSESFGLPATADFMFSLTTDDQLEQLGQLMVKQLKNRFATKNKIKRFVVGVDYDKMRIYDVEQSAQEDIVDDVLPPTTKTFGSAKFADFEY